PGAVRHVARRRAGRDGDAHGPQRHGQDHDGAFDHGSDAGHDRLHPVRRKGDPRAVGLSGRQARNRAGAGGPAGLFQPYCARESGRDRGQSQQRGRAMDLGQGVRAVSAPRRAHREYGESALRRRAADAGDRPRADDQSSTLDPRRGNRGACAAHPRRNLAVPHAAQSRRPVDPGDRQERRGADPHRRSPLPHGARQGGMDRQFRGARGRAGDTAPLFRRLITAFAHLTARRPPAVWRRSGNQPNRNRLVTAIGANSPPHWRSSMGKHELIKHTHSSSDEAAVLPTPASAPDATVTPKMALAGVDPGKVEMPKAATISAPGPAIAKTASATIAAPKIELANIEAPRLAPQIDELTPSSGGDAAAADAAAAEPAEESAAPYVSRFTVLAASLALAAALGAMVGALVAYGLARPGAIPAVAAGRTALEEIQTLKENVVQARVELAALKLSIDSANRNSGAQLTRISER